MINHRSLLFTILLCLAAGILNAQAPQWQWAVQGSGQQDVIARGVVADNDNNIYISGNFQGLAIFGEEEITSLGGDDIFVAKLDENGNWLWARQAGGTGVNNRSYATAVDNEGNVYIAGQFDGTARFGEIEIRSTSGRDIFFAKIDSRGIWQWAEKIGTTNNSYARSIIVDDEGNIYVSGLIRGTSTFGNNQYNGIAWGNIFVAKMDAERNWVWVRHAPDTVGSVATSLYLDDDNNCYMTGYLRGNSTFGDIAVQSVGDISVVVALIDVDGNWRWVRIAGSVEGAVGNGIAVDEDANIYVTGYFQGTVTVDDMEIRSLGGDDIFVAKLNRNGDWLWLRQGGSELGNRAHGIVLDSENNTSLIGYYNGEAVFGEIEIASFDLEDPLLASTDSEGNWRWVEGNNGRGADITYGITFDNNGYLYVAGSFQESSDFGETRLQVLGGNDTFVAKFGPLGARLDTPEVIITVVNIDGNDYISLTWERVENANSYKIYAGDNPYTEDWGEPVSITGETFFTELIEESLKFYTVKASSANIP